MDELLDILSKVRSLDLRQDADDGTTHVEVNFMDSAWLYFHNDDLSVSLQEVRDAIERKRKAKEARYAQPEGDES